MAAGAGNLFPVLVGRHSSGKRFSSGGYATLPRDGTERSICLTAEDAQVEVLAVQVLHIFAQVLVEQAGQNGLQDHGCRVHPGASPAGLSAQESPR